MSRTSKMGFAIGLGVGSFLLFFALGEGLEASSTLKGAEWPKAAITIVGMGLYFLLAQYLLSRGHPHAVRSDWWLILSLNAILILTTLLAAVIEPNKGAVLETAGVTAICVVCSYAGAALAGHNALRKAA